MATTGILAAGRASAAFGGLALSASLSRSNSGRNTASGYGDLMPDPEGLLDLPPGFAYRIISRFGDRMDDGYPVPDGADGMGAIPIDDRRVALVRNHELHFVNDHDGGPFRDGVLPRTRAFDRLFGGDPLPGGTTTILYDYKTRRVERQFLSLAGTVRNCGGGATPWKSWLSCEEDVSRAGGGLEHDHGWVFEVPATATETVEPVPLRAMGRFYHEAATVDPRTGIVYLTEDRENGLFYRFLPAEPGRLARGGLLQALAFIGEDLPTDARNRSAPILPQAQWIDVRWVDLDDVESPADDLRVRGHASGAVLFARGEGVHCGDGDIYFCCTSGGAAGLGQIMRYRPSPFEGMAAERDQPGQIQIFIESTDQSMFDFGDNITLAPTGHLIVCEDQYTDSPCNHLRGVTPSGDLYPFARLREATELAGACFSPDGETLFVNVYSPSRTLAITGPWTSLAG